MFEYLITAGGRVKCIRCTAFSTRTKSQCGRPALKSSKTHKCQFHGGRSTGPKSLEGRNKVAETHRLHSRETREMKAKRSKSLVELRQLEDVMRIASMTSATKTTGRKPNGYNPISNLSDAHRFMLMYLARVH